MIQQLWRASIIAIVATGIASCQHYPIVDASGCRNIQGIVGAEFRLNAHTKLTAPAAAVDAGLVASWTYPEISREFRETLIMGDHLCHAAAAGLIDAKVYRDYLAKQLGGLGAVQIASGVRPEQVRKRQSRALGQIIDFASPALADGLVSSEFLGLADPTRSEGGLPFAEAKAVFVQAEAPLPNPEILDLQLRLTKLQSALATLEAKSLPLLPNAEFEAIGHINFEIDSADVDEIASRDIAAMVATLGSSGVLRVTGYADVTGGYQHNLDLSRRRAEAVANALRLAGARNVVVAIAVGRTDAFGKGRRANRRVVIERLKAAN